MTKKAPQILADGEILFETKGQLAIITLNRPKALNSISYGMLRAVDKLLVELVDEPSVATVLMRGAGEKAFCAGGDVKKLAEEGKAGRTGEDGMMTADFFREEYVCNNRIATYPKPLISLLHGITMGGGVGLSIMGRYRVISERMRFGMPETAIGFFPDVGGSYFMSRMGPVGTLLSLTGQPVNAATAMDLGVGTHFVPEDSHDAMIDALTKDPAEKVLEAFNQSPASFADMKPSDFPRLEALANRCFLDKTVEESIACLEQQAPVSDESAAELARSVLDTLAKRSPTALKVTVEQLKRGASLSFQEALVMEYRMSQAFLAHHDFYEGVRSVLVDKDQDPKWQPANLAEVTDALVEAHFKPLGDRDLSL